MPNIKSGLLNKAIENLLEAVGDGGAVDLFTMNDQLRKISGFMKNPKIIHRDVESIRRTVFIVKQEIIKPLNVTVLALDNVEREMLQLRVKFAKARKQAEKRKR